MRWDADLPPDLVERIWRDPQDLVADGVQLQEKPRCTVTRLDHAQGQFVWKHHNWGSLRRSLGKLLSRSVARKSWHDAQFLFAAGVPTPCPRAYLERRIGPFQSSSYLLSDYLDGTSLYRLMRYEQPTDAAVRNLARQVAAIWQRLDELCVWHNDFKTENLLVDPHGKVWLIDFERMRRFHDRTATRRRAINDARQLFHPRNWRRTPWAAEWFRRAILETQAATETLAGPLRIGHPLANPIPPTNRSSQLVTVLIPCRNAANFVEACIESVRDMADEILVADAGSTDGTAALVHRMGGCRVIRRERCDDAAFETWAHRQAQHPWVLRILPHERLNAELGKQVQDIVASEPAFDAFRIPRLATADAHSRIFHARRDAPVRLYRKAAVRFGMLNGSVEVIADSKSIGRIPSCLRYEVRADIDEQTSHIIPFPGEDVAEDRRRMAA
jgi:hypothetical protein